MSISELKSLFDANLATNPLFVYLVPVVFLACCMLIWVIARLLLKNKETNKIKKIIREVGADYIQNVALPDELDGFVFMDYLILTPTGILVVDIQNYNGFLFGGENVDEWTQMIGHKSYKFKNPLPLNQHHVHAVKILSGNVPVQGRIVFSNLGKFPKGIPEGVSTANSFKKDVSFAVVGNSVPELFQQTWNDLLAIVKESNKQVVSKNI